MFHTDKFIRLRVTASSLYGWPVFSVSVTWNSSKDISLLHLSEKLWKFSGPGRT
jgi:hypothetical protein